jgi:hypothetical protein
MALVAFLFYLACAGVTIGLFGGVILDPDSPGAGVGLWPIVGIIGVSMLFGLYLASRLERRNEGTAYKLAPLAALLFPLMIAAPVSQTYWPNNRLRDISSRFVEYAQRNELSSCWGNCPIEELLSHEDGVSELVRLLDHQDSQVRRYALSGIYHATNIEFDTYLEPLAIQRTKFWWTNVRGRCREETHWSEIKGMLYKAPDERRLRIAEKYTEIKVGMHWCEVRELLGDPDCSSYLERRAVY